MLDKEALEVAEKSTTQLLMWLSNNYHRLSKVNSICDNGDRKIRHAVMCSETTGIEIQMRIFEVDYGA